MKDGHENFFGGFVNKDEIGGGGLAVLGKEMGRLLCIHIKDNDKKMKKLRYK